MSTPKPKIPEIRHAERQVILQGQAGGTVIILKVDPKTGKIVIEKIPDPRVSRILAVLSAASELDDDMTEQVAHVLQPALDKHLTRGG